MVLRIKDPTVERPGGTSKRVLMVGLVESNREIYQPRVIKIMGDNREVPDPQSPDSLHVPLLHYSKKVLDYSMLATILAHLILVFLNVKDPYLSD